MSVRAKSAIALLGLVVVTLSFSGVALAWGGSDTIHACAKKAGGQLRMAEHCLSSETAVTWSERGPRGLQGPAGPSDLTVVTREVSRTITVAPMSTVLPAGDPAVGIPALCETGEVAISGGITGYGPDLFGLTTVTSGPTGDSTRSGWMVQFVNPGKENVTATLRMSVLCVPGTRVG